jgi:predicted AlkP superfamily pyrophosphatase or phosphodiesterase
MNKNSLLLITIAYVALSSAVSTAQAGESGSPKPERHNVLLFITDGMRHDSLTAENAPTMFALRKQGVEFANSHSLYPTFTTPNASAFATGHLLGDTGDFGNALYVGHAIHSGNTATLLPFIENDSILADINGLYGGNYLQEETLLHLARRNGYSVATVGKLGPVAIQDIDEVVRTGGEFRSTEGVIVDDSTGPRGIPLPDSMKREMASVGLSTSTPDRSNGQPESKQNNGRSGTVASNYGQQHYYSNVVTEAILPAFQKSAQPWLMVVWSRDPDGTQHNQGDSMEQFWPGINGQASRAAIRNLDDSLWQIVDYLRHNDLFEKTDIIIAADHGFSTISHRELDRTGTPTRSYAAGKLYSDVKQGQLPPGFLAIDLAHALKKPMYDPDASTYSHGVGDVTYYQPVKVEETERFAHHPQAGHAIIGGTGKVPREGESTDAEVLVAANGGSDLIYLPQESSDKVESNKKLARTIVDFLLTQDYVDGVFVRDDLGEIPGTLPMSTVGLIGATKIPKPAMVVNFKSFSMGKDFLSRVEIADSTLHTGQGMHGSFSRADTFNNMLAEGPDFKSGYVDRAPASNADVAITVAHIMGWQFAGGHGTHAGRVLTEALKGGPEAAESKSQIKASTPGPNGARTVLVYQQLGAHTYLDQGCLTKSSAGETLACN